MKTALILAGHGSHISPNTAGLIWRHVDGLRTLGVADEITAAFWKEMPAFAQVLRTVTAQDVTVIPLFTAQGYFTQTVIPTEMGLAGTLTERDGRVIRYTSSLHDHPYLAQVIRARVEAIMQRFALLPEQTAVAVIGHSTRRNPDSRKATEAHVQRLRSAGIAAQIEAVYLDDSPEIPAIYALTDAPHLIAVPYFLAAGSHTTIDVPRELGLEPGADYGVIQGRQVFYTAPVGVDDALREVIVALAREAGAPLRAESSGDAWCGFPMAGSAALIAAVAVAGTLRFGGLSLRHDEVRTWGDDQAHDIIQTPPALRVRIRQNPFRSLATSDDLPSGWRVPLNDPAHLHAVVETVYPGAVAEWAAAQTGSLNINTLPATAARQTGMYRALESLPHDAQAAIFQQVCGRCVRHPLWFDTTPDAMLPCPEPCNHWLSAALEDA
ncbi:MAG: hypothetical protein H7Y11_02680 [Armatimonadetes bacterium]|nr:hypothetical protein [Anaerolineae bacterium]